MKKNQSTPIEIIHNSDIEECLNILPIMLDFNDLDDNPKTEIINEIRTAYKDNLSSVKLASNLYWKFHSITEGDRVVKGLKNTKIYGTAFKDNSGSLKIRLDEPLKSSNETIIELREGYNKIVDPSLQLNWSFIASNALGYIHSNIKILEYEELSSHSAIYFVYHAGNPCEWCNIHSGEIVRLLPRTVIDKNIDVLSHYNINDPYTETAIWFNKNNIDHEQSRICSYPHIEEDYTCHFELQPIDLDTQEYDPRRKRIVKKVPESLRKYGFERDQSFFSKEEEEKRKPKKIGENLVSYYGHKYEAVEQSEYNDKLEAWKKDASLPIPVSKKSTDYKRMFEGSESIDVETEKYEPKHKIIVDKTSESIEKYKIRPAEHLKTEEENEERKPRYISDDKVQFNKNIYEAVSPSEADRKLEAWRRDNSLPIPVQIGSPQYRRIFGEADKRREKGK
jgi:hypothetical protein